MTLRVAVPLWRSLPALFASAVWLVSPLSAQIDSSDLAGRMVTLRARFPNGRTNAAIAIAVSSYFDGSLLITSNAAVRSEDPDFPTAQVTATRDDWPADSVELRLLEISDPQRGVAFLVAPGSGDRQGFVLGCPREVAAGTPGEIVTPTRRIPVTFRSGFVDGRATLHTPMATAILGAPVLAEGGIVGQVEWVRPGTAEVVSTDELFVAALRMNLPWQLLPWRKCIIQHPELATEQLRLRRDGLPELVERLFQPGTTLGEIIQSIGASERDLLAIFARPAADSVISHMRESAASEGTTRLGADPLQAGDYITLCLKAPADFELEDFGRLLSPVTACEIKVRGRTYRTFLYFGGRWIWAVP